MFRNRISTFVTTVPGLLMLAAQAHAATSPTTIFSPVSTSGRQIHELSLFVLMITGGIFVAVSGLLAYALIRYRGRPSDEGAEPAQVFGSTQIELAWTIIPVLLIIVLFLGTARVIFAVQDAPKPPTAVDVVVVGHQFWWEFRYPQYNVVTANELHIPVSTDEAPRPSFFKLTSADVMHSFWVPRLGGKTDLLPNRVNELWFDPHVAGLYEGQCAQFCGAEHAKMLLRVYVDTPDQFMAWIHAQQKPQGAGPAAAPNTLSSVKPNPGPTEGTPANTPATMGESTAQMERTAHEISAINGRRTFEAQACINCHNVSGTPANGRFGPDLTHLMSRDTIAAGIVKNTPDNLQRWITDPNDFKPASLMPAMHLTDEQNAQITAYLLTLH